MSLNIRICSTKKVFDKEKNCFVVCHPMVKLDNYLVIPENTQVYTDYSYLNKAPVIRFNPELEHINKIYLDRGDSAFLRNNDITLGRLSCEFKGRGLSPFTQTVEDLAIDFKKLDVKEFIDSVNISDIIKRIKIDSDNENIIKPEILKRVVEWTFNYIFDYYHSVVGRPEGKLWDFLPWGIYTEDGVWTSEEGFDIQAMELMLEVLGKHFEFKIGPKGTYVRLK